MKRRFHLNTKLSICSQFDSSFNFY